MKCPNCGVMIPPQATSCLCGYSSRPGALNSPITATQARQGVGSATVSFEARRTGLLRKQKWTVRLAPDCAELSGPDEEDVVSVPRAQGNARLQFANAFVSGYNVAVKQNGQTYKFKVAPDDLSRLRAWRPEETAADIREQLRNWGIGLILLGVAHFVLAGFLDPTWGVIILVVGLLNLLIPRRGMFIVNGLVLLLVGALNIFAGEIGTWTVFGILQLVWGVQEMRKFSQYAPAK